MSYQKGFEIMEEVINKLSSGRGISYQLAEAFVVAKSVYKEDMCGNDFYELQALRNEYDNQVKYQTSTINTSGELNDAFESLFILAERLKALADRIIEPGKS
jgi:hypothetical protein